MPAFLHTLSQCSTPLLLESLLQLKSGSLAAAIGLERHSLDSEENVHLLPGYSDQTV
ncbi:hypothetical protein [Leptolyngbya ohadii]|uniref:hypothetical protein n=1 Tax=Leptolyngbya ohadii TaxID=1962290 RepID=UPI0019D4C3C8|nr:hypothetical protein [Leptolyngbya ohadii]